MGSPGTVTVQLTAERLSVDSAFAAVVRPACGGTALFVGTTRSPSDGEIVDELEYEAYDAVARAEMETLAAAALKRHGLGAVYIGHRVGTVPTGEPSVIVAAAAPHRAEAFAGARELIEELKRTVPIWKKERRAVGDQWIGIPSTAGAGEAGHD